MQTALTTNQKIPWREAAPAAPPALDHYETRQSTVITVRMVPALKRRIDARIIQEAARGHLVSMNTLALQGITLLLDHLDDLDRIAVANARDQTQAQPTQGSEF